MSQPHPREFQNSDTFDVSLKLMSSAEVERFLAAFYLSLSLEARRRRFGGSVSDNTIRRYCGDLDSRKALVFGSVSQTKLGAVVELHPFGERAELAFAHSDGDGFHSIRKLLALAVVAARRQGCRTLVAEMIEPQALDLLRGFGELRRSGEICSIELPELASRQQRYRSGRAAHG